MKTETKITNNTKIIIIEQYEKEDFELLRVLINEFFSIYPVYQSYDKSGSKMILFQFDGWVSGSTSLTNYKSSEWEYRNLDEIIKLQLDEEYIRLKEKEKEYQ